MKQTIIEIRKYNKDSNSYFMSDYDGEIFIDVDKNKPKNYLLITSGEIVKEGENERQLLLDFRKEQNLSNDNIQFIDVASETEIKLEMSLASNGCFGLSFVVNGTTLFIRESTFRGLITYSIPALDLGRYGSIEELASALAHELMIKEYVLVKEI